MKRKWHLLILVPVFFLSSGCGTDGGDSSGSSAGTVPANQFLSTNLNSFQSVQLPEQVRQNLQPHLDQLAMIGIRFVAMPLSNGTTYPGIDQQYGQYYRRSAQASLIISRFVQAATQMRWQVDSSSQYMLDLMISGVQSLQ